MIGGLFKSASVASLAAAGLLMGGVAAQAADLGGNCCADLEERVAELEATTARKGNRVVSLEVSGQVHEAIVFYDVRDTFPDTNGVTVNEANSAIGTHNSSRSRFRFKGEARIDVDWSAGFLMEFGVRRNALNAINQDTPRVTGGIDIRHEALYLKSRSLGTVWLGWTSSATDGITEICLGCGLGNSADQADDLGGLLLLRDNDPRAAIPVGPAGNQVAANRRVSGFTFADAGAAQGYFVGEGDRREVIRYISPTLAGFVLSGAFGGDDFYDAALRYAGELGAIRLAAGVGYQWTTDESDAGFGGGCDGRQQIGDGITANSGPGSSKITRECESLGVSASIQHTPTGLYLAGAYGQTDDNTTNERDTGWHVTAGINQKFFALGKTNIWGMYQQNEREIGLGSANPNNNYLTSLGVTQTELVVYGAGIEQSIDAAAMDIYFWWKRQEAEANAGVGSLGDHDQFVTGARIRF